MIKKWVEKVNNNKNNNDRSWSIEVVLIESENVVYYNCERVEEKKILWKM